MWPMWDHTHATGNFAHCQQAMEGIMEEFSHIHAAGAYQHRSDLYVMDDFGNFVRLNDRQFSQWLASNFYCLYELE